MADILSYAEGLQDPATVKDAAIDFLRKVEASHGLEEGTLSGGPASDSKAKEAADAAIKALDVEKLNMALDELDFDDDPEDLRKELKDMFGKLAEAVGSQAATNAKLQTELDKVTRRTEAASAESRFREQVRTLQPELAKSIAADYDGYAVTEENLAEAIRQTPGLDQVPKERIAEALKKAFETAHTRSLLAHVRTEAARRAGAKGGGETTTLGKSNSAGGGQKMPPPGKRSMLDWMKAAEEAGN
jgi:regulator of replication initiation timing